MAGSEVTDAGLAGLRHFPNLRVLSLAGSEVTDAGLVHLKDLSNLVMLRLDDTQVGDVGLRHISGLPRLRVLSLMETKITDAGLPQLRNLRSIHDIFLPRISSELTQAGLDELRRSMPDVWIGDDQTQPPTSNDVYGPTETEILLARVDEGAIDMTLTCHVSPERLDDLELQPEDVQPAALAVIDALADQLPDQAVGLLRKGAIRPEGGKGTLSSGGVQQLLREGMTIRLRFGRSKIVDLGSVAVRVSGAGLPRRGGRL